MSGLLRVLLLGSTGRLGREVVRQAGRSPRVALRTPGRAELDLSTLSLDAARAVVDPALVDVVLNCAAEARVDRCEDEPALAHAVNATAPGLLAEACATVDVPFVHLSTDYVFGDPAAGPGPFSEDAPTAPAQRYGHSKAAGERAVLAVAGRRTVVRVSWLFGPDARPFEEFVLGQVAAGGPVRVFVAQQSRPTWLPGLAEWLLAVCGALAEGAFAPSVLHAAGGPHGSRADWARAILDARGHTSVAVEAQADAPSHGMAARPDDSRLHTTRTEAWIDATWATAFPSARRAPSILDWREGVRLLAKSGS